MLEIFNIFQNLSLNSRLKEVCELCWKRLISVEEHKHKPYKSEWPVQKGQFCTLVIQQAEVQTLQVTVLGNDDAILNEWPYFSKIHVLKMWKYSLNV